MIEYKSTAGLAYRQPNADVPLSMFLKLLISQHNIITIKIIYRIMYIYRAVI
jgi:hypothetical protein